MSQDETIEKGPTGYWGRYDAEDRSEAAREKFPEFFDTPEHLDKIEQVKQIVETFFKIKKAVYVNHRFGTKKSGPFSTVKIADPAFPNHLSLAERTRLYYAPLDKLGVKRTQNTASNSIILEIR